MVCSLAHSLTTGFEVMRDVFEPKQKYRVSVCTHSAIRLTHFGLYRYHFLYDGRGFGVFLAPSPFLRRVHFFGAVPPGAVPNFRRRGCQGCRYGCRPSCRRHHSLTGASATPPPLSPSVKTQLPAPPPTPPPPPPLPPPQTLPSTSMLTPPMTRIDCFYLVTASNATSPFQSLDSFSHSVATSGLASIFQRRSSHRQLPN